MPTSLPRRRNGTTQRPGESLALKSTLIASALFLAALVIVNQEFYFSAPATSLSETEAALRLAAR